VSVEARNGGLATAPALPGAGPQERAASSADAASPPVPLTATRDAPLGGQAVLEGVMMRGVTNWAVAFRKPGPDEDTLGDIGIETFELKPLTRRNRLYRLPLIRGVVALGGSLKIGMQALGISANAQLVEPGADSGASADGAPADAPTDARELSGGVWAGTVIVAMIFAIGLFFVVPVGLTSLIKHQLGSSLLFWLVEGVIRTAIFLGYLALLARMRDLRRVFEYHGAEHKVISCYEAEDSLTPERAKLYSRLHPRCGTSFLLIVMIMAIFVFAPIGLPAWWILVLTRILGVPVIAGLSFEVIKWAGKNRSRRWVQWVMYPGLQLQKLTTREPDLDQLAVAIAALNAVLERETPGKLTAADLVGVEVVA
jgi:uncharacterized protein YqhQ